MIPRRIKFTVNVQKVDNDFFAYCPEIPGISVYCETQSELRPAVQKAVSAYMEMSVRHGDLIPSGLAYTY